MPPRIDATAITNPYVAAGRPPVAPAVEVVAEHVGVPAGGITITGGARDVLQRLITGPVLINLPTSPAYMDVARVPVIVNQLDAHDDFAVDLERLEAKIARFRPQTVLLANPSNPDGGVIDPSELTAFLAATRATHVIVDETFAPFAGLPSLAPLVRTFPHLSVVGSLRPAYGIDAGYVVGARAPRAAGRGLIPILDERALRTYMRETRAFQDRLARLPGVKAFPSAANYTLLATYRPAGDVVADLARHGVDVHDCTDQWVPNAARSLRIAARTRGENQQVLRALCAVLTLPLAMAA